jgi:long-subunit fatty acid transport protein
MRPAPRIALLAFAFAAPAAASSVLEYPDLGATQLGRGGAWLAYANDASVTFFNPAALARLGNSVSLSANVNMHNACFTRRKATSDTSDDGPAPGETYPEVCANATPLPIPAMAASFRLTPDLTWGIAVVAPNGNPKESWPEFVGLKMGPTRYLLTSQNNVVVFPTLGIGWKVSDTLAVGGAFTWGIGRFEMATTAMALNADNRDSGNDVRATVTAASWFVPGANLSFLSTPTPWLDVTGWVRVSAPIQAKGDITTDANYYTVDVARGRTDGIKKGDSALGNCGNPDVVGTPCGSGNNVSVKLALPIEGKVAVRVHRPNLESTATTTDYDPLRNELYDVELDLTYAQNSVIDTVQVRFPGDANGRGIVTPPGLAGGAIPPNADQEKRFKDVFGARLGGDYVVMPNQLAVRAGVFGETSAQTAQYQNIDFMGTSRFGLAAGLTYRAPVGEKGLDLSVAYMHLFVADSTNDDPGAKGVSALTGTPCNPAPSPAQFTGTCSTSGNPVYRSNWPVNLGRIIQSVNSVSLGAAYRW